MATDRNTQALDYYIRARELEESRCLWPYYCRNEKDGGGIYCWQHQLVESLFMIALPFIIIRDLLTMRKRGPDEP